MNVSLTKEESELYWIEARRLRALIFSDRKTKHIKTWHLVHLVVMADK